MKRALQTLCSIVALSLPGIASGLILEFGAAPQPKPVEYVVQPGDTLWGIARRVCGNGARYESLAAHNKIPNSDRINPGQKLSVSPSACYTNTELMWDVQPCLVITSYNGPLHLLASSTASPQGRE